MRMNTVLPFSLVLPVLIVFSIDPDTSLVADNTFKQKFRDIAVFDDKLNKYKGKNKIQNGEHLCPQCKSHFLTVQPIDDMDIDKKGGQSIQSIKCRDCGSHWKETWTLPNWFWLKSSSLDNHWTSERWNTEHIHSDVQDLELAQGIKDSLEKEGFHTIDSILKEPASDISNKLGIEPYVAQIIKDAAKRASGGISEKETI
jgi:hypothetical protein